MNAVEGVAFARLLARVVGVVVVATTGSNGHTESKLLEVSM